MAVSPTIGANEKRDCLVSQSARVRDRSTELYEGVFRFLKDPTSKAEEASPPPILPALDEIERNLSLSEKALSGLAEGFTELRNRIIN